jgi:hypothetical protein
MAAAPAARHPSAGVCQAPAGMTFVGVSERAAYAWREQTGTFPSPNLNPNAYSPRAHWRYDAEYH